MIKNTIVLFFAAALGVMLALWGYQWNRNRGSRSAFQNTVDTAHVSTELAKGEVARVDTVWLPSLIRYRAAKEANRGNAGAVAVAIACDSALAGDSIRLAARDTLIKRQDTELKIWMNKPGPPRIQPYAEAMYDVANMVPVGRIGVTARIAGPIALSAAGQYSAPKAGSGTVGLQAQVGLRYSF